MSGEFRPEQVQQIESTDDAQLAKAHGLTEYDEATGQYTAPAADADHEDAEAPDEAEANGWEQTDHAAVIESASDEHDEDDDAEPVL
jgi:hypothetical protein